MRLIDADKLKKVLCEEYEASEKMLEAIDNAQTIAFPFEICDNTCQVVRPQGEWLPNYTSQFMNPGKQCSLCGKIVEFSENYCPKCGAQMRLNNG